MSFFRRFDDFEFILVLFILLVIVLEGRDGFFDNRCDRRDRC
ncbi:hypothetical protein [Calditerricola yamamurae]